VAITDFYVVNDPWANAPASMEFLFV